MFKKNSTRNIYIPNTVRVCGGFNSTKLLKSSQHSSERRRKRLNLTLHQSKPSFTPAQKSPLSTFLPSFSTHTLPSLSKEL